MAENIRDIIKHRRIAANGANFQLLRDEFLEAYRLDERNFSKADLRAANLRAASGIASISGVGNSHRLIWAYRRKEDKIIIVRAGCREESAKDVIKAIQTDYGKDSAQGKAYIKAVKLLVELVELQYAEYEGK